MANNIHDWPFVVIGVLNWLGIGFMVLKMSGHSDWSWWLVTTPFAVALILSTTILAFIVTAVLRTRT